LIITGIGSRNTTPEICDLFVELGAEARERGWWIRSGHAEGADYAFERGARDHCIIYMPWSTFNKELPILGRAHTEELRDDALDLVYRHDPYANDDISQGVKRIKQRNIFQVLGVDLKTPSDLVICYTDEGKYVGGTALAMRVARENNIPIINLGNPSVEKNLDSILCRVIDEVGV
jgi:hypothetical protein